MAMDPHLEKLVVDRDRVDTERVGAALLGRVSIDGMTGMLGPEAGFDGLKVEAKVLALLLGRLAAHLIGKASDDRLSLKELVEASGLPRGSAAPAARRLLKERKLVAQDSDQRYFVPRSRVLAALQEVTGE